MFLFLHELQSTGYAYDSTPFVIRDNIPDVISASEEIDEELLIWFSDNQIKLNTDKWHLLMNTLDQNFLKIWNIDIKITFDFKIKLSNHVEDICKKAASKLNAPSRIV